MAAAREEGLIRFQAVRDNAPGEPIYGYVDTRELAPSGKIAEPDKWFTFPLSNKAFSGANGWKIQMIMKSEATDILDNANDSIVKVPAYVNGVLTTLGKEDFQMTTGEKFASPSLTVDTDVIIGEMKIDAGTTVQLGGKRGWLEPYDDTA